MTLVPHRGDNTFPRTDKTFCYICNAIIETERKEGDKVLANVSNQQRAKDIFFNPEVFDVHPILCKEQSCIERYSTLPRPSYFEAEVLYSTEITFDGGSFLGFPERVGWTSERLILDPRSESYLEAARDLESLFQAWLFFGLLHEVLQEDYNERNLVKLNENGEKVLSLAAVLNTMTLWMSTVSSAARESQEQFLRINGALTLTFGMLKTILPTNFSENLRVTIASVGEIVFQSLRSLYPQETVSGSFTLFYHGKPEERLKDQGWCKSEARFSPLKSPTIARQAFYGKIDRRNRFPSHAGCTSTNCEQVSIDQNQQRKLSHRSECLLTGCEPVPSGDTHPVSDLRPVLLGDTRPVTDSKPVTLKDTRPVTDSKPVLLGDTRPVTDSRSVLLGDTRPVTDSRSVPLGDIRPPTNCKPIPLDDVQMKKIHDILDMDTFPLLQLRIRDAGSVFVKVSAYIPGKQYIAISHVWAQGLGNDDENSLNLCQLSKIHDLLRSLWRVMSPNKTDELFFWLDTYCCPVRAEGEEKYRKLAIRLMRETYAKATAVLVIDTEWETIGPLIISPLEVAARIFISSWFQRLWTLQEGALPTQIWFQFQGGPINGHSLYLALRDILRSVDMRDRLVATEMLGLFQSLRILSGIYDPPNKELEMSMLTMTMSGREVKHSEDEATCVATLIGLKLRKILKKEILGERMKAMWQELSRKRLIPRSIIFFPLSRKLDLPGYSWAYSTLRQDFAPLCFRSDPMIKGIASHDGLFVEGEGIVFKVASPTIGFDPRHLGGIFPAQIYFLNIQLSLGQWYLFTVMNAGIPKPTETSGATEISEAMEVPGAMEIQSNNQVHEWTELWNSGKQYALLRKHIPNRTESSDDGIYLLVEIKSKKNDALLCRRLNVGKLSVLPSVESKNNSRACFQASVLQDHEDFRALGHLASQPQSTELATEVVQRHLNTERHFSFNEELLQRDDFPETLIPVKSEPDALFKFRLAMALSGKYAIAVGQLSEDQTWYID